MLHGNTCGVSTAAHIHVLKCIVLYAYYVPPEVVRVLEHVMLNGCVWQ
jgi:hypothetical protein